MMKGVSIRENIGLGDKLQFSSLPENYFKTFGEKLFDVSKPWFWDSNPYVERNPELKPDSVTELWNFPQMKPWPVVREKPEVYLSNAEIWAATLGAKVFLNRPRLYRFEYLPFEKREMVLIHTQGKSHGAMPDHVIEHVINKYRPTGQLFHVGLPSDPDYGIPKISTPTFWDLADVVSKARIFIGVDSGPSWVAACYPDVIAKKIRLRDVIGQKELKDWVPLEVNNLHSHWDDRLFSIHNKTEEDVGFTSSYRKL